MRIKLALTCAFFMSFFSESNPLDLPDDWVAAKAETVWTGTCHFFNNQTASVGGFGEYDNAAAESMCIQQETQRFTDDAMQQPICQYASKPSGSEVQHIGKNYIDLWMTCERGYDIRQTYHVDVTDGSHNTGYKCPPDNDPEYTQMHGKDKCIKPVGGPETPEENDDSCPKLDGMSLPDLAFTATDKTQMCFPNPTGGKSCKYKSDNGVYQLPPSLGESVNCDTGEPEDPFPDNPDDTDTPDDNGCVTKKGQKYCEAKPEDNCKVANAAIKVGDTWDTVMTCNQNCGDIGGTFYCPETPNDDQEPEINDNCTDEVFRLANPTVCSGKTDDTTDKNGDGQVDNKDVVKGLNTGNQLTESILSELKKGNGDQTDEQKKLNEKSFATNQLLSSLNNQVSETNKQLKKVTDKLDKPLDDVTQGKFDIATAQSELEQINIDYQAKINSIKTEALTLIQNLNAGGGSFNSCHDLISMNGKVYNRCLTQFSEEMTPISNGILFFFTVVAGFIVLGGASKND